MKKLLWSVIFVGLAVVLFSIIGVTAQSPRTSWPYFVEVRPPSAAPGLYDFIVPFEVLDKSRDDLSDLRLFDANDREIPYALRIRKELDERREIAARIFNQAKVGATSEVSVDVGESAGEHNQVEIETTGNNFRRRVDVEGSDSGKEWKSLQAAAVIFNFEAENKAVKSNRVSYPISRYRYLRVRVFADELTDDKVPEITAVKVRMAIREKGELSTWSVAVPPYQLLRNQGAPASSWTIDFGGRLPCDRLRLDIADESFSRPFQLENVDDDQNIRLIASGELVRRIGEQGKPVALNFEQEQHVRKLRLLVTDYSNPTLLISSITASAPARQLVFELKEPTAQPLRLYFGNPKMMAPHYDFEQQIAAKMVAQPPRSTLGKTVSNPAYVPEPLPLTERVPWLIYVVLAASSVALALILISLARTTLRTPQPREAPVQSKPS